MNDTLSRRRFIGTTLGAAAATLVGKPFFDARPASASPSHVRRDVRGMTASDPILVSYSKAIQAMRAMDASQPLSWRYQAAIHGTTASATLPTWNKCEHDCSFFWP